MADISWIKLKTQMFDDEKIQLIEAMPEADAILVIWIKLLIQAGKTNSNGYILLSENIPYTTEMLSTIFHRPLQIVKFALKILSDLGMIEIDISNVISITNWEKHQNVEGLDRIREQNRLRQQKYREAKRLNSAQKQINSNVTVTQDNATDIEEDIEKEIKNNYVGTSSEMRLSKLLFDLMRENNPNVKEPNFQVWAKHIDLMKRIDKRTDIEIEGAIRWSQGNDFWCSNILSTSKLRKQYDRLYLEAKKEKDRKNGASKQIFETDEFRNRASAIAESIFNDPDLK